MVNVDKALIVGDFNIHVDNTNDALGLAFTDLINSFGVKQNVTGPTHRFNHTLDLIILHGIDLTQWFSNFLHQVPPQKIFGFPSTTIMTNIKMQYKWLPTAPGVCSRCVCVFTAVCVCTSLSVALYTVKKKRKENESVLILIRIFIIVSLLKYSKYTV